MTHKLLVHCLFPGMGLAHRAIGFPNSWDCAPGCWSWDFNIQPVLWAPGLDGAMPPEWPGKQDLPWAFCAETEQWPRVGSYIPALNPCSFPPWLCKRNLLPRLMGVKLCQDVQRWQDVHSETRSLKTSHLSSSHSWTSSTTRRLCPGSLLVPW